MKAAVVSSFSAPLEIQQREIPEPGPGQVLVHLEACGLCHTDIHAAHGDWPVKPGLPFMPGHEGVGIVEKLGAGVTNRAIGERVAIPWLGYACGECRYCIDGRETLCEQQHNSGYSVDGGFAEYAVASARTSVMVPDGVTRWMPPAHVRGSHDLQGAQGGRHRPDRTRRRVRHRRTRPPRGAVRANHRRLRDRRRHRTSPELELARELGAEHLVNAAEVDPVAAIQELGGADVALVLAASPGCSSRRSHLSRGGRLICVALPKDGR